MYSSYNTPKFMMILKTSHVSIYKGSVIFRGTISTDEVQDAGEAEELFRKMHEADDYVNYAELIYVNANADLQFNADCGIVIGEFWFDIKED